MNRIVIIGNGFDKAHRLPTGYNNFLEHLSNSIGGYEPIREGSSTVEPKIYNGREARNYRGFYHRLTSDKQEDKWIGVWYIRDDHKFKLGVNPYNESIYFESLLGEKERLGYWSDLETHYFQTLYKHKDSIENIKLINEEFEHLKRLLFDYLKTEIEDKIGTEYVTDKTNSIYKMLKLGHNDFSFEKTFFVTFNYTAKILNQYFFWLRDNEGEEKFPLYPIHIHGDLEDSKNPIIFGYGDENTKQYNELELLQNNELLKNFKTFQYLRSNRYNEILGLLAQSGEVYIQIIGHSCGLCDKSLLRTIFQHENVKYIEPTYYENESRYFENTYNISRLFDDNALMRKKVIPLSESFMIE